MCTLSKENKQSKGTGILSVVVMFMLTYLGVYSAKTLNDPSHSEMCSNGSPAVWAVSNFYFSTFGGGIGAFYELYLVLIDKTFEVQTLPLVPRIRGFNAGYIFTVGLIFDAFMVIGPDNAKLLNVVTFFLGIVGTLIAPGMAFPNSKAEKIGQAYFGGTTILSMLFIFFQGTAFGGEHVKLFLAGNKLMSAVGAILTPPNKSLRTNIQFHILRFIANIMLLTAYLSAQGESSCFPQKAEAQISPNLIPAVGASVVIGWMYHLSVSTKSKTKAA